MTVEIKQYINFTVDIYCTILYTGTIYQTFQTIYINFLVLCIRYLHI